MKLCFIATNGDFGGSEILWCMTAKEALLAGIVVMVSIHHSFLKQDRIEELIRLGAKLHVRADTELNTYLSKFQFKLRCYIPGFNKYNIIKKFAPNLVIVSQGGTYDAPSQLMLYKFLIQKDFQYIIISQFHKENKVLLHPWVLKRTRVLFQKAKRIYFVSKNNKSACESSINIKLVNSEVINNPIKFIVEEIEWPEEDVYNLACVARVVNSLKRQDLLIALLAQDKWKSRNVILNIYGTGKDLEKIELLVEKLQMEDKIKVHGHKDDIINIWKTNHLFVLPSIAEGLPLALIEANLMSRAAITTKVGDNERLVIHGKTGFLIEDLSEEGLDQGLELAWENRHKWKEFGSAANDNATKVLDINIHHTLLRSFLKESNE